MQKVLIADACDIFPQVLSGALRSRYLVEVCDNGASTLAKLRALRPDVLILDLMLPDLGGMAILKAIREESLCSGVIVVGRFFSDYILDSLKGFPVDFVALKPCPVMAVVERVDDLCNRATARNAPRFEPHCAASGMLLALNFPVHKKGYGYCRDSILMLAEDPGRQVTKEIYPEVAKVHGTTKTAVEKAIRDVIDDAWEHRDDHLWRQYFVPAPNGIIPRPSNTRFLSRLADVIANEQRMRSANSR